MPGALVLPVPDATAGFRSPQANWGYITLDESRDPAAIQRQVAALLADNPEVGVRSQADFLAQLTSQVNTSVVLLYVLLGLSIVIAVLGIINTLVLSIVERTRELGLVRAVGMPRAQVIQLVAVESVVIAVFGALLGIAIGVTFGAAIQHAVAGKGLNVLSVPVATLVMYVVVGGLIGVLAAVWPAWRASRLDVLKAIAFE